ncbi:MAG TPA: hypothetical protein VGO69_11120 [Pyrinomonadaceae bacterium]|jgi:hypothetical protein|nr:hypothetical protein [Pyrinomonadaceae bacterium]
MKLSTPRNAVAWFAALLLVISITPPSVVVSAAPQRGGGRITALKVSTLDSENAELSLSEDIFKGERGNKPVRAGTGAANYPEHHLVVLVELTGGLGSTGAKVELRATEGRKLVWRKISDTFYQKLGADTEDQQNPRTYAIFFIEGMRCETLKLTARYVGPGKPSSMTRTIEFACGE